MHIKSIYQVTFNSWSWLSMWIFERTICMIAKDVFVVEFMAWAIVEASNIISNRRLKQNQFILVNFPNRSNQFFVKRKQKPVIIHAWPQKAEDILPPICSRRLVDQIISQNIWLALEERDNISPHFDEFIVHSIFVCEEIIWKFHHIIC